ncbi:uncharacterized protein A4U43_C02F110 [Asparagus officinalis]|uniref:Uncharacterized protein n=1 Tax=Asparagus officinalis TaxID=4686 RepID=A0A5P1FFH9_ASPOF|nr:uncharacterized protein A4U43_C02F110 [Asparagus officinalis]
MESIAINSKHLEKFNPCKLGIRPTSPGKLPSRPFKAIERVTRYEGFPGEGGMMPPRLLE